MDLRGVRRGKSSSLIKRDNGFKGSEVGDKYEPLME